MEECREIKFIDDVLCVDLALGDRVKINGMEGVVKGYDILESVGENLEVYVSILREQGNSVREIKYFIKQNLVTKSVKKMKCWTDIKGYVTVHDKGTCGYDNCVEFLNKYRGENKQ